MGVTSATAAPFGLTPVRYLSGAKYTGAANVYAVLSGDSAPLGLYDPVASGAASDALGFPTVTRYTGGSPLRGVVVGFLQGTPGQLGTALAPPSTDVVNYRPASTLGYVFVADDPNLVFQVQDNATSKIVAADIGLNCDLITAADCNTTTTFLSVAALKSDTKAVTATLQVKILRLSDLPNNLLSGAYPIFDVVINQHELMVGSLGQ